MESTSKTQSHLSLVRRARRMARQLAVAYPQAHCELHFDNAFQLLVATVLSAQTTDQQVNAVTPSLFGTYPTPDILAEANPEHVQGCIRSIGFFRNKTSSLIRLSQVLVDHFDGQVPSTLDQLVTLPGVGRKTANVVLGNVFGVPGLTVDTHFGRLVRRWAWTSEEDPVKIESAVAALIPKKDWTLLSHRIIFHGRRICNARKPACGACFLQRDCPSFGIGPVDTTVAAALVKGPERAHLLHMVELDVSMTEQESP